MVGELVGAYRLLAELGTGGMGTVYLAEDGTGARVALKVVHPHLMSSRERFVREAEIGKRIRHKNVVAAHGVDEIDIGGKPSLALIMEYVEGQTLRGLLEELGQVPEELCRHIAVEIANGLTAIHDDNVVHRDLKPENVLITKDHVVKVMDLGIARVTDETVGLSQTGTFVGSVKYGAPEQFQAFKADARTDLYALGLVLYELSTGTYPFGGDTVASVVRRQLHEVPRDPALLNPQLTPFFEEVIKTLLAKDREERFASAHELLRILEQGEQSDWWVERARTIRTDTRAPLRRVRVPRDTALFGRDVELDRLRALFDSAKEGEAQVVLVEGEAGIGKTRLVDEFVGRLRDDGEELNFIFGGHPPGGAATASGALITAYADFFGEQGSGEYLAEMPLLVPAFDALLKGEPPPDGTEPLTKESLQAVLVQTTRGAAAERPTIVLVDDMHFAPEGGRALFAALALGIPGHRVMLVGTARPGVPEDWIGQLEAVRTPLHRLGPKDLAALLIDAFGSERLARELAYQIGAKSDGNPFFTFEIIRGLREGRFIKQKADGTWVKTQVIDDIQIPSSLVDLIEARISDLGEDECHLLEVAACCGYEFEPRLVGEVLGLGRIPALQKLARIEKSHRLIRSVGPRYLFDHHQVQEAMYVGLSEPLREEYHAALAEALEARDHDDATAVELCMHLFKAGKGLRAKPYLESALEHLGNGHTGDAFIDMARRALAVDELLVGEERVDVLLRTRTRLDLLGQRDEERVLLKEAVALADECDDAGLRARAYHEMGSYLYSVSRFEPAREHFAQARRLADEAGNPKLAAQATGSLGGVFFAVGRYDEARRHHAAHRALAQAIGDRAGEARAAGNIGLALKNLGQLEKARRHLEQHLEIARTMGDRRSEATATGNIGLIDSVQGRMVDARRHFERCLDLSREIGFRQGEASATGNLGNAMFHMGYIEEARELHMGHRALCREIGDRRGETIAAGNMGITSMRLGRYDEAGEEVEYFLRLSRELGDRRGPGVALEPLGRRALSMGDTQTAREHITAALRTAREISARRSEGYALHALGMLEEHEGTFPEASRWYGEALALRRSTGFRTGEADTLVALGRLEVKRNRKEAAAICLGEALDLSRTLDAPAALLLAAAYSGDVHTAEATLADHEKRLGVPESMEANFVLYEATGKQERLDTAVALLEHIREHAPEEYRESMLNNVPLLAAIAAKAS